MCVAFNLINDIDVAETEARIQQYRQENAALIELNMKREEEYQRYLQEQEEAERQVGQSHVQVGLVVGRAEAVAEAGEDGHDATEAYMEVARNVSQEAPREGLRGEAAVPFIAVM